MQNKNVQNFSVNLKPDGMYRN